MDEEKTPQKDSTPHSDSQPERPAKPETTPTLPAAPVPLSKDVGWAGAPTSQVVRTVAAALLTVVVVLVALFLLWQVRTFIG
jgi:hypothetical protein